MPHQPILINWLITGRCPLTCRYCYVEDLMRDEALEPKSVDIERIVESILSLNPLVVVVKGGHAGTCSKIPQPNLPVSSHSKGATQPWLIRCW